MQLDCVRAQLCIYNSSGTKKDATKLVASGVLNSRYGAQGAYSALQTPDDLDGGGGQTQERSTGCTHGAANRWMVGQPSSAQAE
jgi:hypothetical protein